MTEENALVVRDGAEIETTAAADNVRSSWNFSASQIIEDTQHFGPEIQELMLGLFRWCIDPLHPMRRQDVAQRLECSPELIYQLLTGKYRNPDKTKKLPTADFVRRVREFLVDEMRKHAAISDEFVITPTAKKVFDACKYAKESHTPVMLYGTSHIGKTWALQYFRAHNNHGATALVEIEAVGGLGDLIETMAAAVGESYRGNTKKMRAKIEAATTSNTLWIFDEVHLLAHTYRREGFFAALEFIRRLHDKRKCGMVLCWTRLDDLDAARSDELKQICRRGVHVFRLPNMPTQEDLTVILEKRGLEFPDKALEITVGKIVEQPRAILRQLAKEHGLKAITERIRYAAKLANKKDGKISWHHFVDAHLRIKKNAEAERDWD